LAAVRVVGPVVMAELAAAVGLARAVRAVVHFKRVRCARLGLAG